MVNLHSGFEVLLCSRQLLPYRLLSQSFQATQLKFARLVPSHPLKADSEPGHGTWSLRLAFARFAAAGAMFGLITELAN